LVPATSNAQSLSLEQALQEATGEHPSIEQAEQDRRIAENEKKSARTDFFPTLSASASAQYWNDEITFSTGGGGGGDIGELPPPENPYQQIVADAFVDVEPTTIREQFTWDTTLTLTQPLTPLWSIAEAYKAAKLGEQSAQQQLTAAERQQAQDAAIGYFRVLQAKSNLETAQQSVEQLKSQADRVRALVEAGSAQRQEKLRIEVALANARQEVSRAKSDLKMARSNLAVTLGRSPDATLQVQNPSSSGMPEMTGELADQLDAAMKSRPELRQLELERRRAETATDATRGQFLPQLVGLAQYQHTAGQGLTGQDTFFVGASLEWEFVQWGRRFHEVDISQARRVKVESSLTQTRRQLRLQVRQAWYDLEASLESYRVAERAVEQAEEAYRVESARFEAGRATPTELLDAQSALTEAKNNRNAARYETLINHARLTYATGRPLTAQDLLGGNA
jgi:outer membrane protein TolC